MEREREREIVGKRTITKTWKLARLVVCSLDGTASSAMHVCVHVWKCALLHDRAIIKIK